MTEAVEILKGLRDKYEAHHRVKITDEAIDAAVKLADRYITDRQLPDKAIDVIDEASSRTRLMALTPPPEIKELGKEVERVVREKDMYLEAQEFEKAASLREKEKLLRGRDEDMKREWDKRKGKGPQTVSEEDIEYIVSRWTGIPLSKLEEKESAKLARMEEALHGRIVGQDDAIAAVSRAIRRSRAGLKDAGARWARSSSWAPPASARPSWPAPWPSTSSATRTRSSGSTCPSTWRSSRSPACSAPLPATWATKRAATSPRRSAAARTRWCSSTRSRRPIPTCSTCCSRCWTTAA